MQEYSVQVYPERGSIKSCPKCGVKNSVFDSIEWVKERIGFTCSCGAKSEHICIKCYRCGYRWPESIKEPKKSLFNRIFG